MKQEFINCTPHAIKLNDGRSFDVSEHIARVSSTHSPIVDDVCSVNFGEVTGLPAPKENTLYIVSAMVKQASNRKDLVSPATGHPLCKRENGNIISVPGFIL